MKTGASTHAPSALTEDSEDMRHETDTLYKCIIYKYSAASQKNRPKENVSELVVTAQKLRPITDSLSSSDRARLTLRIVELGNHFVS